MSWADAPAQELSTLPVAADVVAGTASTEPADKAEAIWGPDLLLPFWRGVRNGPVPVRVTLSQRGLGIGVLAVSSTGPAAFVYANALAAALSRGPGELVAVPHRGDGEPLALTAVRAGRCLAAVGLLPGAWPSREAVPPASIVARLAARTPPHTVLFGGSGLGKTTLLEALVEDRLAAGRTTVVIDPHGDLAARAAVSAQALDQPASCVDFGDIEQPPRWNLTRPPMDADPREWATELLDSIQACWADADRQWFGPVFRRSMHSLLLPLILDPRGPWPLTRLPDIAAPRSPRSSEGPDWRTEVLARIGDPAVTRDLWEAVRMMDADRESHARTWLLSKLEPLLRHPGMRRVVETRDGTVDVDGIRSGRSLFVAAPASALGDEGATVVSLLVLRRIWGLVRREGPPSGGLDVVLDEAHRMPAGLCSELLAEGRKYGVQLRLASQSPSLLAPELRAALLTNAGTVATLRLGTQDAVHVASRLAALSRDELSTLPPHQVAVAVDGEVVIGAGPPGRGPDDGTQLRTAHRKSLG
ncbi:type IV secretion system DNA-binding domain-containing protein [Pseudonocardia xishanensis]|uniref:type IV secretion system DNA-binding domain-containing protein n=1 Tax=Pseudonocardia xishanensis TaxID=630995 RepID=UPI0031F06B1E